MKIISWNVNGIRSVLKKGFLNFITRHDPDILCIQETKARPEDVNLQLPGYYQYWNSAQKRGYSGTAIFAKKQSMSYTQGMGIIEHDQEGRVLALEFANLFLVNVYTPNSKRDLSRLDYRVRWDADFLAYLKQLELKKPVIFCGDLNVAHKEIDLANPRANEGNHGFTREERSGFDNFLKAGFLDTFREFHQQGGYYTWWSFMNNARARNIGWRIDYFCISSSLQDGLKEAFILPEVMGSDHCPIGIRVEGAF